MAKVKVSHTIDEELVIWLESEISTKRFGSMSHGIEYALTLLKGMHTQPQTKHKNVAQPELAEESAEITVVDVEVMRQKWWVDKKIGMGIVKVGGIGLINLTNIIQRNPDLFETKEECRSWLHNKLKSDPPPEVIKETLYKKGIIPNQNHTRKKDIVSSEDTTEPPKFTPNRSTAKCPGCEEEHLEIPGSTIQKCPNCGYIKQSNQHAPAQDVPPSPPQKVEQ